MAKARGFALIALLLAVPAAIALAAIRAPSEYLKLEVPDTGVVFYYHPRDARAARYLSKALPRILERMSRVFDEDLSALSCRVIVAASVDDYMKIDPGSPSWSVGRAYPDQNAILILSGRAARVAGKRIDLNRLFAHELLHLVAHERLKVELPRYFEEGLARYVAGEVGLGTMSTLSVALIRGDFIPLGMLVSSFPLPPEKAKLAYAESESFVWFLVDRYGPEFLGHLFAALERERDFGRAIEQLTGTPLWELEYRWRSFLQSHHTIFVVLNPGWLVWWLILAIMFGVGIHKLVRARKRLREMEDEELRESLGTTDRGGKIIPLYPDSDRRRDRALKG
ncbi:MAG TPA: hypothetical protein ENF73_04315 [Proteobacteria bacterium]|nr:hypothetical protein [Pseudomonadota bacterium]